MEFKNKYEPQTFEGKWFEFWKEHYCFSLNHGDNDKPKFSIILPPPNVTGHLHLGHAWDGSIQDCLIRYKKLQGFQTIWLAGTDHAGIATQIKFEKHLKLTKDISKEDLGKKDFLSELLVWKQEQADFIHEQWKKMGFALDSETETFSMDDKVGALVNETFTKMYNNKLIYQDYKLVNWDPILKTAISDIEVISKPTISKMYYFKYRFVDNQEKFLNVATTRPETMFGDACLVVNPKDKRYLKYINMRVINPANHQQIKIIADPYVDMTFGTGVMKCTPAHDFNDNLIAKRHKIKDYINVMNYDGTMNDNAIDLLDNTSYNDVDRFITRKKIVEKIKNNDDLIEIKQHNNNIGYSERSNAIVEPLLSKQWFIKMKPLVESAIELQNSKNKIKFTPDWFENTLFKWFDNIEDWCISRQLWWGHQLPVWYHNDTNKIYVGIVPPKDEINWTRDENVLDTWFSSALWPIVTTDLKAKDSKLAQFFPISVLVTAYDILFFWVGRMIIDGVYLEKKLPFKDILIHGLIRDEKNQKMSKSLGNGIDPMKIIQESGADTLRLFLISSSTMGEDLKFSEVRLLANGNFLNKLWNAGRYVFNLIDTKNEYAFDKEDYSILDKWILNELATVANGIARNLDKFNFSVASKILIDFVWNIFCNQYLELFKSSIKDKQTEEKDFSVLIYVFKNILILLHPFCPFITEELYQHLPRHLNSIMQEKWIQDKPRKTDEKIEIVLEIIENIRKFRSANSIPNSKVLQLKIIKTSHVLNPQLMKILLYTINSKLTDASVSDTKIIISSANVTIEIINCNLDENNDKKELLKKRLNFLKKEIVRSNNVLSNENFILKASKEKINEEKSKYNQYLKEHDEIVELLKK